jgi:hypothetical protein
VEDNELFVDIFGEEEEKEQFEILEMGKDDHRSRQFAKMLSLKSYKQSITE